MKAVCRSLVVLGATIAVAVSTHTSLGQDDEGSKETSPTAGQATQAKGCPWFSGMSNYEITGEDNVEFDAMQFCDGTGITNVEGKVWRVDYGLKEGASRASGLQIMRNYGNAVRKLGGRVFNEGRAVGEKFGEYESTEFMAGTAAKNGKQIWVHVTPDGGGDRFRLAVLEVADMKQEVSASDMLLALNTDGFIALHVNFDANEAKIRPESLPIIEQIVQLLKQNSGLKVSIEGHTDNTGNAQKAKVLSQVRAKTVMEAVVAGGVGGDRLSAVGWGPEKPVADNRTEDGRAKNRRVEIVKK